MIGISGYFLKPQNFSVNDGNGIRTIIFFAGCPLRCQWCCNPESWLLPEGCKEGSGNGYVHKYSTEQLLELIERQRIFYRFSGGGITFSGGEATLQAEVLRDMTYRLYDKGIDLALETSGCFEFDEVKDILEKQSLIFIDIKHMDSSRHREYTGAGNEKILENASRLSELRVPAVVRIPVIDGVNSDAENIRRTAQFVKANMAEPQIELLPYHSFGDKKYEALGLPKPSEVFKAPASERLEVLNRIIAAEGVEPVSFK
jgi:pyruvate formate lyase activating enzyme